MLRIALLIVCITLSAVSMACAAFGPSTSIGWTPLDRISSTQSLVYLRDDSLAGHDIYDSSPDPSWKDYGYTDYVSAAFRRDNGVGDWDGQSGWYSYLAYPLPQAGSSLVVGGLYVWAGQSYAYDTFNIGYMSGGYADAAHWVRILRLVKVPDSITYNGPREWTIPLYTNKSNGLLPNGALPAYKTTDPLSGYQFEIEIQHLAVPEPSSILALASGLVGACGFTVKRRNARVTSVEALIRRRKCEPVDLYISWPRQSGGRS